MLKNTTRHNPSGHKNVSSFIDRHGQRRWRYRKSGFNSPLGTEYDSPEFLYRLGLAQQGLRSSDMSAGNRSTVEVAPAVGFLSGSVSEALRRWASRPERKRLTNRTRLATERAVEIVADALGCIPLAGLRVDDITAFMSANVHRPTTANRCLGVLRGALEDMVAEGKLTANPATSVPRILTTSKPYHTWEEADISAYLSHHKQGSVAYLALMLMLYTGGGRQAAVEFGPHNLTADRFRYVRHQTSGATQLTEVDIPLHSELREALRFAPAETDTFLATVLGTQRDAAGLGSAMRVWCDEAGISECTSFGLRYACRRRLIEAGATEQEIAAVLGYSDITMPHDAKGMGHRPALADIMSEAA